MTRTVLLGCIFLAMFPFTSAAQSQSHLENGGFGVTVNEYGVLTSGPPAGLRALEGPVLDLPAQIVEWFGVAFSSGQTRVEAVGPGRRPDWAGRRPVSMISFDADSRSAIAVTRVEELEIRTTFTFDRHEDWLLAHVELTNQGTVPLRNVLYSREYEPGSVSESRPGLRREADSGSASGWTFPPDVEDVSFAPASICRLLWNPGDILPGATRGLRMTWAAINPAATSGPVDVPLELWTSVEFPLGVEVGETNGISWGDFDRDGFIDMFACQSANLWRNLGGTGWELAADLDNILPFASVRYGSSFGDYNNDGFPDIGTEPRNIAGDDTCFHLLKNLAGSASFIDVATDPAIIDEQPCGARAETLCWGDVDGDGDLDAFLPVYPPSSGGPGNFFLHNLGPTGPGGAYRFTEAVDEVGLDNPPGVARPEGAQFLDVDRDGDLDLYSNATLYQNQSTLGNPFFVAMTEAGSGIGLRFDLEEGAMFFDYDLDGDEDLVVAYVSEGVRIWESYGDGMFFAADQGMIDSPFTGLNLGMSAEDWDNDGDIDFTTRQVFRRNMFMEEGVRHFTVASTSIPPGHISAATPAWGDWDLDGDLDCALGNYFNDGHFYENTLYNSGTPADARRYVRVRVLRESTAFPEGLETEYGASVEVRVEGDPASIRRRKFVASAHGYLNQNEYTLQFALPAADAEFEVVVDFPSLPEEGIWRVDRHINPVLGDLHLADLTDREIVVLRDGTVRIGAETFFPQVVSPRLVTTTNGLSRPGPDAPLSGLVAAPGSDWFVGLDFSVDAATDSIRVTEILLDGQLDDSIVCADDPFNVIFWDVTNADSPQPVFEGAILATTSDRNRRHYLPVDVVLPANRHYRVVAHVTRFRPSPILAPVVSGSIEVAGGLSFSDDDFCDGANVVAASLLPGSAYLALRFSEDVENPADVPPLAGNETTTRLGTPFPNPFEETTVLSLELDEDAMVTAAIFDVAGRRVRLLERGPLKMGTHLLSWNGERADGTRLAPGRYFLRAEVAGRPAQSRRLTLLR